MPAKKRPSAVEWAEVEKAEAALQDEWRAMPSSDVRCPHCYRTLWESGLDTVVEVRRIPDLHVPSAGGQIMVHGRTDCRGRFEFRVRLKPTVPVV